MHKNEENFRAALDLFNNREYEAAAQYFSEDLVWHYPCRNPLQGVYHGREGLIDFFTRLYDMSNGAVKADTLWILADDEHVTIATPAGDRSITRSVADSRRRSRTWWI